MELTIENKSISVKSSHSALTTDCHVETVSMLSSKPKLTVIIPVYNEFQTIDELLRRVVAVPCVRCDFELPSSLLPLAKSDGRLTMPLLPPPLPKGEARNWGYSKQVIVVNDGSTDGTAEILEKWRDKPQVELLSHSVNRGKGAAIRTGLAHAWGKFIIVQDADLEYDPADYPLLVEPLLAGKAQVVYGSRYLNRAELFKKPFRLLRWGVSGLNWAVRLLYGVRLTDEATCYKAFSTELLKTLDLQCERFEFCPEVTAKLCRRGEKILEVPIHYESRNVQAGKKLRWTDGIAALKTLWKYRKWKPTGQNGNRQEIDGKGEIP